MIVAHRGASREAPENTIPAFRLAWEQGTDAIEGDFHLTKDGQIVCIHEKNTKRVSNRNLVISESTLAELRTLDVGGYRGKDYKGTAIPTIAEVFSTILEQKKIYIDIKCGTSIIPFLLEEIKSSDLKQSQIVVMSFDEEVIRDFKINSPQIKTFWLSGFKRDKAGRIVPSLETVLRTLKQTKADGFNSSKDNVSEALVRSVIKHGYEYHVWTVDDLKTAKSFKRWGVKSITTNVPGYMKKNLDEQTASTDAHKPCR